MDGNPKRRYGKRRYFVLAVAEPPFPPSTGVSKRLGPGSSMRLPGMTQYIAWWTCFGGTFPPFHLSTFPPQKTPFHLKKHLSTSKAPFHINTTTFRVILYTALLCCYWI